MIYCVWYPSGGFGHFINAIISMHGRDFVRPGSKTLEFGSDGNAHTFELVAPKYFLDPDQYHFDFDQNFNYTVLIDNGINNQTKAFQRFFPESQTIKICYSDVSWPVVAYTMITKATKSSIQQQLPVDKDRWPDDQDWAHREKYFLFLRDSSLRQAWKPDHDTHNLLVEDLFDYNQLKNKIQEIGIELDNFDTVWKQWRSVNSQYIDPVTNALEIVNNIKNSAEQKLDHVTDLWSQAVLYYFIWQEFGQEVPHNDYSNFFSNTREIQQWLNL